MAKRKIDELAIFNVAVEEFSKYSYEDASLNRIIIKAGIPKGSFYYRFDTKYALYIHILRESNRIKWQYIQSEIDVEGKDKQTEDIFDLFLRQAEIGAKFADRHPAFYRLGRRFSREKGTDIHRRVIDDLGKGDDAGIENLIQNALEKGLFRKCFSADFLQKLVKSLFLSFDDIFFRNSEPELDKSMEYLREFVLFLKYGLSEEPRES
jgi:TetR/AcrR family transcriptional regulator